MKTWFCCLPGTATTNNAWFADVAAQFGSGKVSITIPINIANVRTVGAQNN